MLPTRVNEFHEQEVMRYIDDFRSESLSVAEYSLTNFDSNIVISTRIFDHFLEYAQIENVTQIYHDNLERVFYFQKVLAANETEIISFDYVEFSYDLGGIWSLIASALILIVSKVPEIVYEKICSGLNERDLRRVTIFIILWVGLIAI
jgi:hypothetical protein